MLRYLVLSVVLTAVFTTAAFTQVPNNEVWGYAQMVAESSGGVSLATARLRGGYSCSPYAWVYGEYDFANNALKKAQATATLGYLSLTVGRIATIALEPVFPPPHAAFFSPPPEQDIIPMAVDNGAFLTFKRWHSELTVQATSGEGPGQIKRNNRTDTALRLTQLIGPAKIFLVGQTGERVNGRLRQYLTSQAEIKFGQFRIGGGWADRSDTKQEGSHLEIRSELPWKLELGLRRERLLSRDLPDYDRLTVAAIKTICWKTSLQVEGSFQDKEAPIWCATLQYGFRIL